MTELDCYIKNMEELLIKHDEMKMIQKESGLIDRPCTDGLKMMIEFSIKTAKKFKDSKY